MRAAHSTARLRASSGEQPVQLAEEDQLVDDLHLLIEAALLGQIADPLQAAAGEGLLEEADASRVGNGDAHHHANGAGLARPVRSQQAEDLARLDGEARLRLLTATLLS
jgi:hypothetical protein